MGSDAPRVDCEVTRVVPVGLRQPEQAAVSARIRLPSSASSIKDFPSGGIMSLSLFFQPGSLRSERVLERDVVEVAVLVRPRLADELAGEEAAVAGISKNVTGEGIGGEQIHLRADVAGTGSRPRPENGAALVVQRVTIGIPPEEILLEG